MKSVTLLLAVVLSVLVTSCTMVPAGHGSYSYYDHDTMHPGLYFYDDGYHDHYFNDRYRDHDDGHQYINMHHYDHDQHFNTGREHAHESRNDNDHD